MNLKRLTALAGALALALPLTACGDDDGDTAAGGSFCDQLQGFVDEYGGMDGSALQEDPSMLMNMGDTIQSIADAAPEEIKEDWETLATALGAISSLATATPDPEDSDALEEQMEAMQGMQAAGENIETHAQEECGITLEEDE